MPLLGVPAVVPVAALALAIVEEEKGLSFPVNHHREEAKNLRVLSLLLILLLLLMRALLPTVPLRALITMMEFQVMIFR